MSDVEIIKAIDKLIKLTWDTSYLVNHHNHYYIPEHVNNERAKITELKYKLIKLIDTKIGDF